MISAKVKADRGNAQASTGPKTARGKARAAQNARRHGLSLSIGSDPVWSEQIESLAQEIVGETTDPKCHEHARRIAEAQIDLNRIHQARQNLLLHNIDDQECGMTELPAQDEQPQDPQKIVVILSDLAKQLILIDRYEQRALSRT